MAEQVKKVNGLVSLTLTKRQAEWLYDLLAETFDNGASTGADELNAADIGDKIDSQLGNM